MRRQIDLDDEMWKSVRIEAIKNGQSMKDWFEQIVRKALSDSGTFKNEKGHTMTKEEAVSTIATSWDWNATPETLVVPGKVGADVPKVDPGPVRPSVTKPIVSVASGSFGRARPAPKGTSAKRK